MSAYIKDPDAVLDYTEDWSAWLATGETITAATAAGSDGITVDPLRVAHSDTAVTFWAAGGTTGAREEVTCHVVTSDGREDDRTVYLYITER